MKKIFMLFVLLLLLNSFTVFADDFDEAKNLINLKVSCNNLSNDELEIIGDYYMEQVHSGEAHELMEKMGGGEGSSQVRQLHINMAKSIYCNKKINIVNGGMMSIVGGSNMMNGDTMFGGVSFLWILYIIFFIGMIILVYLAIIKLWQSLNKKKK